MSNNTTKPNTSKKKPTETKTKSKKKSGKRPVSTKHISLPGNKELKMNFTRWVMLLTLVALLILVLVTYPQRSIRNHIKSLETKEEIVSYCDEKNLNCTFTVLADYDIEGYKVARVAFLDDDFFGETEETEEQSDSESEVTTTKPQKNVYITVQKGESVEVPE